MISAILPPNETARLEALREVAETVHRRLGPAHDCLLRSKDRGRNTITAVAAVA